MNFKSFSRLLEHFYFLTVGQNNFGNKKNIFLNYLLHFFRTRRGKEEWLAALFEAIKELYQRKSSLKIGREILRPCDPEIGKKQPHILKLEAIHKCMECAQPFSMMRKKYNCRACGVVSSLSTYSLHKKDSFFSTRIQDFCRHIFLLTGKVKIC